MKYTKDKTDMIVFRISDYHKTQLLQIAKNYNVSIAILCRNIIIDFLIKEKQNADLQSNLNDQL